MTILYAALFFIPAMFVGANKLFGVNIFYMEALCIYGYSFVYYIMGAICCIVPDNSTRWGSLWFSCGLSSCFIIVNFKR